ncbi:hypothetical protein [Streptomyces alanosinicus]|uniref:hypothetical protein n=1 Tax=Streptomyces alanosinicus TaxID=68171 RepID=UPI001E2D8E53|nr:hypothetical protein [Streptomyces alanosinicus]
MAKRFVTDQPAPSAVDLLPLAAFAEEQPCQILCGCGVDACEVLEGECLDRVEIPQVIGPQAVAWPFGPQWLIHRTTGNAG